MALNAQDKKEIAEIIALNVPKKRGALENVSVTNILQVLIVAGILGFIGNYITTTKQNVIQAEFNKQVTSSIEDLSNNFIKLSDKVQENTAIERYTKFNAQDDLNPLKLQIDAIKQERDKDQDWRSEMDNFKQKMSLEIELLKADKKR